jgi:hypothetical protein
MSSQDWKDKNSNYKIKVSSSTVAKLRKGTKASNIAAANKAGASAEYKEAVRRFYGKNSVSSTTTKTPVKPPVTKTPGGKPIYVPTDRSPKGPDISRGNPKPTPAEIAAGKKAKKDGNKAKLTPNNREGRKPGLGSPKPSPGPGGRKPAPPRGGPGSKPRPPKKGQTPNQREGRRTVPSSPKPSGGPGNKMPKRPSGGPGAKPKSPKVPVIQRGNPKPTQAQMDRARRARISGQAGSISGTRSEQKKPTQSQLNVIKNKKIADKKRAEAYKQRNKMGTGTNTTKDKISGDRYRRSI